MNVFSLDLDEILLFFEDCFGGHLPQEFNGVKLFDLLINSSYLISSDDLISSIRFFIKSKVIEIDTYNQLINFDNNNVLNRYNWDDMCKIIQISNFINKKEEERIIPANKRAEAFIRRIKKEKIKNRNIKKEVSSLSSIISGLANKSATLNYFNIWDLTIYQLFDSLYRNDLIDAYDHLLTGIYSGSINSDKINLADQHWTKILKL